MCNTFNSCNGIWRTACGCGGRRACRDGNGNVWVRVERGGCGGCGNGNFWGCGGCSGYGSCVRQCTTATNASNACSCGYYYNG